MTSYKCPHCGNTDQATIEDNGLSRSHPDLTLLCVKPCSSSESTFDARQLLIVDMPIVCGMQWEPNFDRAEATE